MATSDAIAMTPWAITTVVATKPGPARYGRHAEQWDDRRVAEMKELQRKAEHQQRLVPQQHRQGAWLAFGIVFLVAARVVISMPATLPMLSAVPISPLVQPRSIRNTLRNGPIPDCMSAMKKFTASKGHRRAAWLSWSCRRLLVIDVEIPTGTYGDCDLDNGRGPCGCMCDATSHMHTSRGAPSGGSARAPFADQSAALARSRCA
jgi:hypothetical protein